MPFLPPTNSVKALKAHISQIKYGETDISSRVFVAVMANIMLWKCEYLTNVNLAYNYDSFNTRNFVNITNTNTMALFHKNTWAVWHQIVSALGLLVLNYRQWHQLDCVHIICISQHFNICTWVVCAHKGWLVLQQQTIGSRINDALIVSRSWWRFSSFCRFTVCMCLSVDKGKDIKT